MGIGKGAPISFQPETQGDDAIGLARNACSEAFMPGPRRPACVRLGAAMLQRKIYAGLILAAVVLAACGPTATVEPTPPKGLVVTGSADTALLHALVGRVLEPRSARSDPELTNPPVLYVGELPPDLPATLPLPEGAVIIGSLSEPATVYGPVVYLDVPLTAPAAIDFYTTALAEQGYALWQPGGPPVFTGVGEAITLCQADAQVQVNLSASALDDGPTAVAVTFTTDRRAVSCDEDTANAQYERTQQVLPTLVAPPGVTVTGDGSSYSIEGQADLQARLRTSLTPAELAEHYAASLAQQGWAAAGASATGPVAWSEWSRRDDQGQTWNAVLIITAGPAGSDQRQAEFRMALQLD